MPPRLTPLSALRTAPPVALPPRGDVVWAIARARNALRRPGRLLLLAGVLAVATAATLVFVPRRAQREARTLLPDASLWRDTVPLAERLHDRQAALAAATAAFAAARDSAIRQAELAAAPPPPLPPEQVARRDSLAQVVDELERALERVAVAPLLASYRTLGETRALRDVPQVRAVLDTLAAVERQRETFGTEGGADPVYVALTARANELGRRLQAVARDTLDAASAALDALRRPRMARHPLLALPPVDTLAPLARLTTAREEVRLALDSLDLARASNREYARQVAAARRREMAAAPPLAVLVAALVVGTALAYLIALASEIARPRVGGVREVERLTGTRVLALAGPRHEVAEWNRRRTDQESARGLVRPGSRTYRMLYLHLSATGMRVPIVTVTGPDPTVLGVVAVNLAVAAAADGRGTLLVDLDAEQAVASRVLRLPPGPGVTDVRAGRIAWPEGVSSIPVGRDRLLDVIGSGTRRPGVARQAREGGAAAAGGAPDESDPGALRRALTRMARRYDFAVLSAPLAEVRLGDAGLIALPDTLVCARVGITTHRALRDAVLAVSGSGLRVAGIVLWDGALPEVGSHQSSGVRRQYRVPGTKY